MKNQKPKRKKLRLIVLALLVVLIVWTIWANKAVQLNKVTITSENLPKNFDGYKIALVSDLHNTQFGEDNEKLIELLRQASPDIIAITGDLTDSYHPDIDTALCFAEKAVQIAPCYYVPGNHEGRLEVDERENFFAGLKARGVTILDDKEAVIDKNGEKISLIGVIDSRINYKEVTSERLNEIISTDNYTVLLCHQPQYFEAFLDANIDLALCGHVHGGQFRLPFVGGLYAPNQGYLPEYDGGVYTEGNTNMVVSRGLGNSVFPMRFNNRPEIVLIELKTDNQYS